MNPETHTKIRAGHLQRNAYLYVRQSTLRQVLENSESTKRQYDLRQRAVGLGWPLERIVVIDTDLGQSGASAVDREGFQRLVTEVSLGHAGIVMGLEVSRLARNNADWHRLLEICALAETLILDEDGVYDPAHFNDRLLLGLKGTMSEAELHVLRARLRGGLLNKARRGELWMRLPIGFVYDEQGRERLDPDLRIQGAVRRLFQEFRRTGSATATVKSFRTEGLHFPRRVYRGPRRGEILWGELEHSRVLWILHHPRYTGAFCFGRTRQRKCPDGRLLCQRLPAEDWIALIRDAHEGYISWEEYEENLRRLRENARLLGDDRQAGPPREGPALLQGLAICAVCGERMTIRYDHRRGQRLPLYVCQRRGIERAEPVCQWIPGAALDQAIGRLLIETVSPVTLEVALTVQQELQQRAAEVDRLRRQEVEQSRFQADLSRRRYMQVDPDNRLVAETLEAEWNQKLRQLAEAQERYERNGGSNRAGTDENERAQILALATDFPRLWKDPRTEDRERKRMARLLIEDVTLLKATELTAQVRFKGGATRTLTMALPLAAPMIRKTQPALIAEVDQLLEEHTDAAIAAILNERGVTTGAGERFRRSTVARIRRTYALKSRYERLRAIGMLTLAEAAQSLGVTTTTIKIWRRKAFLRAHAYTDRNDYLFEPPGPDAPIKHKHKHKMNQATSNRSRASECERSAV